MPPPFRQISDHYVLQMRAGQLKPGDFLPPVTEIMSTWKVSRATASKATDRLKMLGLVETVPARGLRVIARTPTGP